MVRDPKYTLIKIITVLDLLTTVDGSVLEHVLYKRNDINLFLIT